MVWRTPANKMPRLSSVIVASCCVQTNSPCHVKSMGIVPMHEWKVPLKYLLEGECLSVSSPNIKV